MWTPWVGCIALVLAVAPAEADDKKPPAAKTAKKKIKVVPGNDFWKILVKPNLWAPGNAFYVHIVGPQGESGTQP